MTLGGALFRLAAIEVELMWADYNARRVASGKFPLGRTWAAAWANYIITKASLPYWLVRRRWLAWRIARMDRM